jgi:hypothetical protein
MSETIFDPLQIQPIDTLLVGGTSFLAHAIQDFEKCSWNHAGMFVRIEKDFDYVGIIIKAGLYVAEMTAKGLVLTEFQEYIDGKSNLLICRPKFPVNVEEYYNYIYPKLFKEKYGFFNLLVAQPIKFLTNHRIWLGSNDDNPKRLICGEFCEMTYNHFNPDIFPDWKWSAPSDIFKSDLFTQFQYSRTLFP